MRGERPRSFNVVKKKYAAAVALAAWVLLVTGFSALAQSVDLEIYFVLFLIGLLITVELIDGTTTTPRHLRLLKYCIAAGVIIFGWIVATKVMEILAQ